MAFYAGAILDGRKLRLNDRPDSVSWEVLDMAPGRDALPHPSTSTCTLQSIWAATGN